MSLDFLSILELFSRALPALANVTVAVLHSTGADKHKTVAADIAQGLQTAGQTAGALHLMLLNGANPAPARPPDNMDETPGGGA